MREWGVAGWHSDRRGVEPGMSVKVRAWGSGDACGNKHGVTITTCSVSCQAQERRYYTIYFHDWAILNYCRYILFIMLRGCRPYSYRQVLI